MAKAVRCSNLPTNQLDSEGSTFHNLLRLAIPHRDAFIEICIVRQMASDRGLVAEHFILHDWFSRPHGIEEVGLVIDHVAVSVRRSIAFSLFLHLALVWSWHGMLLMPRFQILLAQLLGPALGGVSLGLRTRVLRLVGERRVLDNQGALSPVETAKLSTINLQIAP